MQKKTKQNKNDDPNMSSISWLVYCCCFSIPYFYLSLANKSEYKLNELSLYFTKKMSIHVVLSNC